MKKTRFPRGWNEKRVSRVLAHYEKQSEEQAIHEDEAAFKGRRNAVVQIPIELMPLVREIIARFESTRD